MVGSDQVCATGRDFESEPAALTRKWLLWNRKTTSPRQLSYDQPRDSAERHHMPHITARPPAVIGDRECCAPAATKKAVQYVEYPIQCSRVARSSGIAADLFCPVDRRCDTYSVVVHVGGLAPPVQANRFFGPIKRTQSTLACELNTRAVAALDEARRRFFQRRLSGGVTLQRDCTAY